MIELGAEATISDREFWKQAQSELYYQLGDQLRQLWHNGTGADLNGTGGAESHVDKPAKPETVSGSRKLLEHWCDEHQMAHTQKHGKDGSTWWSHKAPDGSWCRE